MRKKIVLITLGAALCISLTACGSTANTTTDNAVTEAVTEESATEKPSSEEAASASEMGEESSTEDTSAEDTTDVLVVAQDIKDAVANKDLEALSKLAIYPVYVGIGDGMEIASEDDFMKLKRKQNEGLTEIQKLFGQVIIAVIFFFIYMKSGSEPLLWFHAFNLKINIGWLYGFFILFMLVASSNAVTVIWNPRAASSGMFALDMICPL